MPRALGRAAGHPGHAPARAAPRSASRLLLERARLAEEWQAAGRTYGEGSPQDRAAWEALLAAEEAIGTTVATTPEGIVAQFAYIKASYCSAPSDQGWPALSDEIPLAFLDVIA